MTMNISDFLAGQKRLAEAQATAYERMVELGRGVGFLAVKHPEMRDSMEAWMRATENEHADTVLRLIAALEAVRELHVESEWKCGNPRHTNPEIGCPECYTECETCDRVFPCDTFRAIEAALGASDE